MAVDNSDTRSAISKNAWQYNLRWLVVATVLAPPLLALLFYGSIWAWHALPSALPAFRGYLLPFGVLLALTFTGLAMFWPPPGSLPAVQMKLWQSIALAAAQFLGLWPWYLMIAHAVGWLFIWGDLGPPKYLNYLVAVVAAAATGVSALRMALGLATLNYAIVHIVLAAALLLLAGSFWLPWLMR